jgi:hypothetical protein
MKKFLLLVNLLVSLTLHANIHNIPKRDLTDIKNFFHNLVLRHDFGYTIFGSKPMSLADICLRMPENLPIHKHLKARFLYTKSKRSLTAWYKYRHEFHFKDFIFLDQEEDLFDCLVLVLINKRNMLKVLNEHISVFKEELGDDFAPESFLARLENREVSLSKAIHDSDRLLGIMLGYGERNATLFQQRFDLLRTISKRKKENLSQYDDLEERLNAIEAQLDDFSECEENALVPPLYFLADNSHSETHALRQKYAQDRRKIEEFTQQRKFIDEVLKTLTGTYID